LYRADPPASLSRDLLLRALAHQLQELAQGGAGAALRRRLRSLVTEFEKGSASFASDVVPKTGTTLVRQWRGRTHTVLVGENGFEYEGQRYRSLTLIAERITGAVATENRIRAGADAAMGYPCFAMLDLLKLLGGLLVGLFRSRAAREAEMAFLRQACRPAAVRTGQAPAAHCRSPDLRLALSAVPFRAPSRGCLQA